MSTQVPWEVPLLTTATAWAGQGTAQSGLGGCKNRFLCPTSKLPQLLSETKIEPQGLHT